LGLLATLEAKIAAAYLFFWMRGWFQQAGQKERLLAESHWRTAQRMLDSMGYLRGAVMKAGQTLANFPDILPRQFVETLEQLHYDAPPMHWALLGEMVRNELGDEPECVFESFDRHAFAAASLGQVHRARLKTGQEVAVKIQYPGIARAIREDFRNLFLFLLPGRLNKDWQNMKDQFDDLLARLERETDYTAEAAMQERVSVLFHEDDDIVVPRVYPQYSTARVLTTDFLDGVHIDRFLARNPTQEERNRFAVKIVRTWFRMLYAGRLSYADIHPGNFLFLDDGRLGVIDFGFMVEHGDEEWKLMHEMDRAMTTGLREDLIDIIKKWSYVTDDPADADRLRLHYEFSEWCWRPRYRGEPTDFGDEVVFRRGVDLFTEMVRKRYSRSRPCTPAIARLNFGAVSMLYRLKAKIDIGPIAEEEVKATGWDRSDYT
jgi:predicted unusual protein kinase regulating ubiquinone biosynthesis (AarF/ABC1/UbiB family)